MSTTDDRLAIIETCTRMAWHADQREWDRLAGIFADSVTLDYTSLNGGEPAVLTPAQIVGAWSGLLGAFDTTPPRPRTPPPAAVPSSGSRAYPPIGFSWQLIGEWARMVS
ncbi:nuclear transport factor 2 family protein [Nonomuraea roseoviolacea]|uniref:SnoaL-like domain-containing protein n=1 Tax=Nonomuraea roseoviolacea subsp. carminata TaxID=160689 RepID=A0ABT1KC66_9ACTN|nr:nuclear transport factor 2 family protein [Nonomuraea roseoviolacea]MCP2351551.1 hypothetical protein [Nonomuraea roseoviolacea subsp. carminata]